MNLKNLLLILSLFASTIAFSQQEKTGKKDNLLFMLRQKEHINQALKTVEYLKTSPEGYLNTGKVAIIVCGEAVTLLTEKDAEAWVETISKYKGVSIMACGLSLDKFKKSESELVKGIEYTKNGFIKAFELQKQGYLSVEL